MFGVHLCVTSAVLAYSASNIILQFLYLIGFGLGFLSVWRGKSLLKDFRLAEAVILWVIKFVYLPFALYFLVLSIKPEPSINSLYLQWVAIGWFLLGLLIAVINVILIFIYGFYSSKKYSAEVKRMAQKSKKIKNALRLLSLCQFLTVLEIIVCFLSTFGNNTFESVVIFPLCLSAAGIAIVAGVHILKPNPLGIMFSIFSWVGLIYFTVSLINHWYSYGLNFSEKTLLIFAFCISGLGLLALIFLCFGTYEKANSISSK